MAEVAKESITGEGIGAPDKSTIRPGVKQRPLFLLPQKGKEVSISHINAL